MKLPWKGRKFKHRNIVRNSSGRIIHAKVSFSGTLDDLNKRFEGAQEVVDSEFRRHLQEYVPYKDGGLSEAAGNESTSVFAGEIIIDSIYAHYQNFLDFPYKTLKPDDIRYTGDTKRGPHFIERVIEEQGDEITKKAQEFLDRG